MMIVGGSSIYNGTPIVAESIARVRKEESTTNGNINAHLLSKDTPTIFASINYRIGPLGFPQGAEAQSRGAVNLGAKDVEAALQWIQANIGAFGGDPTKV